MMQAVVHPAPSLEAGGSTEDSALLSSAFIERWDRLLRRSDSAYAIYQSHAWWNHLNSIQDTDGLALALVQDDEGVLDAAVPVRAAPYTLDFTVSGRTFARVPLRCVSVLGGWPRIVGGLEAHEAFFRALRRSYPDCPGIHLKSVLIGSPCQEFLDRIERSSGGTDFAYRPDGIRTLHTVVLPATFEEYLGKFRAKKRYNLRRQVRLLRDSGGGPLRLIRVESEEDIDRFQVAFCGIAHSAGNLQSTCGYCEFAARGVVLRGESPTGECLNKNRPARVLAWKDLARRGLFHSYILQVGDRPCAYIVGYRHWETYHYSDIAYVEEYAQYSPGSCLLFLAIQDLIESGSAKRVCLGITDAAYKRSFGNEKTQDATYLVLPATPRNRLLCRSHAFFRMAVSGAKAARTILRKGDGL